jgi:glycine cleavage system protein P-like pyridoxal-binding family
MKYATSKENMQSVLDALEKHMEDKIAIYNEFIVNYPNTAEIFEPKIEKAQKTMKLFPQIISEYFE